MSLQPPMAPMNEGERELVIKHFKLVNGAVKKKTRGFGPRVVDCNDLRQAGFFGLLKAIRSYKEGSRVAFQTWAYRKICFAIQDHLREMDHATRNERRTKTAPNLLSIEYARYGSRLGEGGRGYQPLWNMEAKPEPNHDGFEHLIRGLGARNQLMLRLHFVAGLSAKEVGRAIGVKENTIHIYLCGIYDAIRARYATRAASGE